MTYEKTEQKKPSKKVEEPEEVEKTTDVQEEK